MANQYQLRIGVKRKRDLKKVSKLFSERCKRLSPKFLDTRHHDVGSKLATYEIYLRVFCSWRTAIELKKFAQEHQGDCDNLTFLWCNIEPIIWERS